MVETMAVVLNVWTANIAAEAAATTATAKPEIRPEITVTPKKYSAVTPDTDTDNDHTAAATDNVFGETTEMQRS